MFLRVISVSVKWVNVWNLVTCCLDVWEDNKSLVLSIKKEFSF